MKKIIVLMLAMVLALAMVACGDDAPATQPNAMITKATAPVENPTEPSAPQTGTPDSYTFVAEGVTLTMGMPFDGSDLSKADNVVELPSCAIEGTDIIYTYADYEITASDEGDGAYLTAILLLNKGATPEGVAIGDDEAAITAAYGDDCENDGTQYTYQSGNTLLCFLVQDGVIISIEYRLDM